MSESMNFGWHDSLRSEILHSIQYVTLILFPSISSRWTVSSIAACLSGHSTKILAASIRLIYFPVKLVLGIDYLTTYKVPPCIKPLV